MRIQVTLFMKIQIVERNEENSSKQQSENRLAK